MRAVTWIGVWMLSGCEGPPAPDVEVCRDSIHRLCVPNLCPAAAALFSTGDCEATLRANTGCAGDGFVFTSPDRAHFLNCRVALLRAGQNSDQHPDCDDVNESFDRCPDVQRFFAGKK